MKKPTAKKICLVRPSAIGDTVHALGLVNGLRKGYPEAHLTWILQPIPFEMVRHQPNVNRFITFDRKGGLKDWIDLCHRIRKDRYDIVLVPQASAKTTLITAMLRADIKIGFDYNRSRDMHWLVTNNHIRKKSMGHVQDQFFEFLEYLGIKNYPVKWDFQFTKEEIERHKSFYNFIKKRLIGFVIASAHPEKDWPAASYSAVMDYAAQKLGMQPLIIGGPSNAERKIADNILRLCRCRPIVALEKPIRNTMLQLAYCNIVVSPDTGPLHIAVALNTPVIGLYGYSNPRRCGPYKKFHDLLIDKYNNPGEENAPITRKTKPGRMQRITVDEVIEKIELGLEKYNVDFRNISFISDRIGEDDF